MIGTIFCSHSLINGARLVSFFLQTRFFVRVSPRVVLPVQNVEYHPSNESGPPYPQDIIGGLPTRKHLPPSTYLRLELFSLATKIEKPLARFMPKKGNWVRTFFFSMSYILQDTTLIRSKTSDLLEALVLEVPSLSTRNSDPSRPNRTDIRTRHRILTQKTQTCTRGAFLRRERTPIVKFIFLVNREWRNSFFWASHLWVSRNVRRRRGFRVRWSQIWSQL